MPTPGDKVQIGRAYMVEFLGFVFAGYQPTSITRSRDADVFAHKGTRNETDTYIISDPGEALQLNLEIEADTEALQLKPGDVVRVTAPGDESPTNYLVTSASPITLTNMIATLTVTLERKASLAAELDAMTPVNEDS
jgi:hypothetical protein